MTAMADHGVSYALLQPARRQASAPAPSLWRRVLVWRRRQAGRLQLAAMDERSLRDLGLSRIDAWQECRKPFWRA